MGSPASDHAEMQHKIDRLAYGKKIRAQYEALLNIYQTVGFGHGKSWAEKELARHLEDAFNLSQLMVLAHERLTDD